MIIRQATQSDAAAIRRLLAQLGYPDLKENDVRKKIEDYAQAHYHLMVAVVNKDVIGFISLHTFDIFHSLGKIGRISAFCIDENFRSQGIGIKLLEAAEQFLATRGCTKIEVTSNIRRTYTHAFYLNRNYTEDSKRFVKYVEGGGV